MITAQDDGFVFSNKSITMKIPYAEILYIEQFEEKLWIVKNDKIEGQLTIPGAVRDISNNLEARFYQCHSYLIINIRRVVLMSKATITFDNGCTKHLGRDAFVRARKAFLNQSRDAT